MAVPSRLDTATRRSTPGSGGEGLSTGLLPLSEYAECGARAPVRKGGVSPTGTVFAGIVLEGCRCVVPLTGAPVAMV
ncbi:hypothetical protein MPRF_54690 [Mycolicibacterium parafortuitum]|uniref:Uncharacterized protein n=1 Tax=Mycolicibacterium parafortuitum TaxID=39692 RepID=A0A7I7UBR4_MYCPF|nr:hypothetical protein MPRF_54690 [Mycolicibacterium parafortuitum]